MSGWVDAHAHVFARGLPLARDARYAPDYDAPLDAYLAHLDAHGFARGILVQPSFLGTDNGYLLAALRRAPGRLRGIAVVDRDASSAELGALAGAGIVGLRLNLIGTAFSAVDAAAWRPLLERAAELRFQIEVQSEAGRLPEVLPPLLATAIPAVVVDHFGLPDPEQGAADPGWRWLVDRAAREARLWLKLSAPYRLGPRGLAVAAALAPVLRDAVSPNRMVVGSDWPQTRFEGATRTRDTMRALAGWLPDEAERQVVLEDAPARLFGFRAPPPARDRATSGRALPASRRIERREPAGPSGHRPHPARDRAEEPAIDRGRESRVEERNET